MSAVAPQVHASSILDHALAYAASGIPVFPCNQKKEPLTQNGFKDATTDPNQIRAWWRRWQNALIGMPTGKVSGFNVLDVDVPSERHPNRKNGYIAYAELVKGHDTSFANSNACTASYGKHIFLKYSGDKKLNGRNLGEGIDLKTDGGYVILAPSVIHGYGEYIAEPGYLDDVPEIPDWLLEKLTQKEHQKADHCQPPTTPSRPPGDIPTYVQAAIDGELSRLAAAPEGERNSTTNSVAFSLAQWIPGGYLSEQDARELVLNACNVNGLVRDDGEAKVMKTINSGLSNGILNPRTPPEPTQKQKEHAITQGAPSNTQEQEKGLVCVNIETFMATKFPERKKILAPILYAQTLAMIHAMRGVGKTFIALFIAYALAVGGRVFDRWNAPQPARVLLLDGEMPANLLQERFKSLIKGFGLNPPDADYLRIITPDMQDGPMPNIATPAGQKAIAPFLDGVDLIIADNLTTLFNTPGISKNDELSWEPVQKWLLEMRRISKSVLLIHHQNKKGDQLGTITKETILDIVIKLSRPNDYSPEHGARFEVDFTKSRGIFGADVTPFEAKLYDDGSGLQWITKDLTEARRERVKKLLAEGLSVREVAEETGGPKSTVQRWKNEK